MTCECTYVQSHAVHVDVDRAFRFRFEGYLDR